ncbi:hypothetical protein SLE2022_237680 [Rubroshorea leprosula]
MELESCVPPGFRFHPTEEELVGYYLKRKINSLKIDLDVIIDVDLYKMEPWDIQARCKSGYDEQNEWYFFSHKDRKYPTGTRTNRATATGFWKATGRDKAVMSKNMIIGMRKTLVFYKGRAPNGRKTDWIMHEFRIQTSQHEPPQEEGWVVCRAFRKPSPNQRQGFEAWDHVYHVKPPISDVGSSSFHVDPNQGASFCQSYYGSDTDFVSNHNLLDNQVLDLQQLDSPSLNSPSFPSKGFQQHRITAEEEVCNEDRSNNSSQQPYIDEWKNMDSLFVSQMTEASMFSFQNSSAIVPQYEDYNNHVLGCFPDSWQEMFSI